MLSTVRGRGSFTLNDGQGAVRRRIDRLYCRGSNNRIDNDPAASCGVSVERDENCPKGVTPECFYRGSSQSFAWIPA